MIITNSVIKLKGKFKNKNEIKNYLYSFIQNHPFRKYNQKIADEYGEHLFSMTFIPNNIIVLTQRYPTEKLYLNSLNLRDSIIKEVEPISDYFRTSEPFEFKE